MNLYVATSFKNIPEARLVMRILEEHGHRVTHNWTNDALDPAWTEEQQDAYLQNSGANDYAGVLAADAVVLVNHEAARDAMTEFGIALGLDMKVFVLYPKRRSSVFFHRATLCQDMTDLLVELRC